MQLEILGSLLSLYCHIPKLSLPLLWPGREQLQESDVGWPLWLKALQVFVGSLRLIPSLNSSVWPLSKARGEGPEMWFLQS